MTWLGYNNLCSCPLLCLEVKYNFLMELIMEHTEEQKYIVSATNLFVRAYF